MSLLARVTDFAPGTEIQSQPFDDEFNQLVNLLAGVSQNKSIRVISNDSSFAAARFDQRGTNDIIEGFADGAEVFRVEKDGDIVGNGLTGSGGIYTFGSIPVLPASSPVGANDAVRKQYVDDKAIFLNHTWFILDPTSMSAGDDGILPIWRVPAITSAFVTKLHVIRAAGSHTPGTDIEFAVIQNGAEKGTIHLDNTNNGSGVFYTSDIADFALTENQPIWIRIKTKTGVIAERSISIELEYYQKVKSV